MAVSENLTGYLDITRRQFIQQLEEEIAQLGEDMGEDSSIRQERICALWEQSRRQKRIARKRRLIERLS